MEIFDNIFFVVFFVLFLLFCSFNNEICKVFIEYFFLVFEVCLLFDIEFEIFYDENFDGIIDEDVLIEGIDGEYFKFWVLCEYLIGFYVFVVIVIDGCGNISRMDFFFDVVDCYIDVFVCINGLVIELLLVEFGEDVDGDGLEDIGVVVIWVIDFFVSIFDDCLGFLEYFINVVGEEVIRE